MPTCNHVCLVLDSGPSLLSSCCKELGTQAVQHDLVHGTMTECASWVTMLDLILRNVFSTLRSVLAVDTFGKSCWRSGVTEPL